MCLLDSKYKKIKNTIYLGIEDYPLDLPLFDIKKGVGLYTISRLPFLPPKWIIFRGVVVSILRF